MLVASKSFAFISFSFRYFTAVIVFFPLLVAWSIFSISPSISIRYSSYSVHGSLFKSMSTGDPSGTGVRSVTALMEAFLLDDRVVGGSAVLLGVHVNVLLGPKALLSSPESWVEGWG